MTTISTSILIKANSKEIWNTLLDFDSYPEWNPFISAIKFTNPEKTKLEVMIAPPNSKAMKFTPKVVSNIEGNEFSWLGKLGVKGLFDGHHSFAISEQGDGQCLFTQSENFKGILVPIFKKSLESKTLKGFELMNEALKKRIEQ